MTGRHRWDELAAQIRQDPVRRQRVAAYERAMRDVLRVVDALAARGIDVSSLPDLPETSGGEFSEDEDVYLATLRDYAEALGGRLEVSVVFPDCRIPVALPRG